MHRSNWAKECLNAKASTIGALAFVFFATTLYSQTPQAPSHSKPSGILFAANPVPLENGKPGLPSIDPIAVVNKGALGSCFQPKTGDLRSHLLSSLRSTYSKGHTYPIWSGGASVGIAETVSSCIGEDDLAQGGAVDLEGCVRYKGISASEKNFAGIMWTGSKLRPTHPSMRKQATRIEQDIFRQQAMRVYVSHGISVNSNRLLLFDIWKIEPRPNVHALAGNVLVQIPTTQPSTFKSIRLFLIVEQSANSYQTILTSMHTAKIYLDSGETFRPGEELDEENDTDKETFFDTFPLFTDEPDVILTRHFYYESWAYSLYRWTGTQYTLAYTGCGGGT